MKRLLKIISLIMSVIIVAGICAPAGYAYNTASYADFYYSRAAGDIDTGVYIVGVYENVEGEITVPNRIMGIKVSDLLSLCHVDENGNEIESDKIITKVNIPENTKYISQELYEYNPYFSVDEDNQYYSSENGILFNKDKTVLYSFPSFSDIKTYKIPETVSDINDCAFRYNNTIEKVILPENECCISCDAIVDCHSLELEVSEKTEMIERAVSNIKQINIDEDNENYFSQDNIVFSKDKTKVLFYAGYEENGVDIVLPDTVKEIDDCAFENKNINSIALPDSLEKMGVYSISGCNIKELHLPASLKETEERYNIGELCDDAWGNCFVNNDKLEKITVDEDNEYFTAEDGVLYNKDKTEILLYPAAKKDESYTIGENITYIHNYAFSDLSGLKEIVVPEDIPDTDLWAFCDKEGFESSLDKVSYEGTLEEWMSYYEHNFSIADGKGSYYSRPLCSAGNLYISGEPVVNVTIDCKTVYPFALAGCTSLESVTLTDNVEEIGWGAFYCCSNLKTVNFGSGLRSIETGAFRKCYSLEEAMLNSELDYIGGEVFSYCTSLKKTNISDDVFYGCTSMDQDELKKIKYKIAVESFFEGLFVDPSECYGLIDYLQRILSNLKISNITLEINSLYEYCTVDHDYGYELNRSETYYTVHLTSGGGGASALISRIINSLMRRSKK